MTEITTSNSIKVNAGRLAGIVRSARLAMAAVMVWDRHMTVVARASLNVWPPPQLPPRGLSAIRSAARCGPAALSVTEIGVTRVESGSADHLPTLAAINGVHGTVR